MKNFSGHTKNASRLALALLVSLALTGCSSDPEGPSDEMIRKAFEQHLLPGVELVELSYDKEGSKGHITKGTTMKLDYYRIDDLRYTIRFTENVPRTWGELVEFKYKDAEFFHPQRYYNQHLRVPNVIDVKLFPPAGTEISGIFPWFYLAKGKLDPKNGRSYFKDEVEPGQYMSVGWAIDRLGLWRHTVPEHPYILPAHEICFQCN